jgi:transcription termination factor Rho
MKGKMAEEKKQVEDKVLEVVTVGEGQAGVMDSHGSDRQLVQKLISDKVGMTGGNGVVRIKKGVVKVTNSNNFRKNVGNGFVRTGLHKEAVEKRTKQICGILDTFKDNLAIIRKNYSEDEDDTFIPINVVRKYKLQAGDVICGEAREPKENDRYWGLMNITMVNDLPLEEFLRTPRVRFHQLTPVYPDEQIKLESGTEPFATRIIDLIAPIGKGQRSLIVSPPKAGKTILLKEVSTGVAANYPDIHLMAVLIGERPEEVTDMRRHIEKITQGRGEVAASNFDEAADTQCRVAELALERAKRLVEKGRDVVILLDSITRLARAYNLSIPTSGRTLSGGFDPAALFPPKRFFGAARNFEVAGSLTIVGTALVDTGSRMDDLVYEEFKGTGNQELHLDRRLAERRIYPAIDVQKSGTRRDDLLIDAVTYQAVLTLQRMLDTLDKDERTTTLLMQMKKSKSNKEFLQGLRH